MENKNLESIKSQLIENICKKLEDKIIEESNANLIIKLINHAENIKEAVDIASLGTTYKRTGFHFDKRLDRIVNSKTIKYFKKNDELSFRENDSTDKPINKLIIGDNFLALENLLIQYKKRIDVIYIDPPYGKDSMGEFAHTNYDNAITRDNLLSMLYPRLVLAKELLSEDGVIFCSIDDKNQAYIKCLFDEVFEEKNYVETFVWVKNSGGSLSKTTLTRHEYVICYAKEKETAIEESKIFTILKNGYNEVVSLIEKCKNENRTIEETRKTLTNYYNENKDLKGISLYNNIDENYNVYRLLPITAPNNNFYDVLHPITKKPVKKPPRGWSWTEDTMQQMIRENRVEFGKDETYGISQKLYLSEAKYEHKRSTINSDQAEGNKVLTQILNEINIFGNPKPISVLNYLFYNSKKDAIILDFFAGSGTTGQAVLELNKEDDGNRQFILCQMNEKTDTTPNGIVYDVTSKRLKRIMTGKCYDDSNDFEWIKKNKALGGNLDVYDIKEVADNESTNDKTPFDVIDETLYGKEKFDNLQEKIAWVCENFENCEKEIIE